MKFRGVSNAHPGANPVPDLDGADLCAATANILTFRTEADVQIVAAQLQACPFACQVCADE
ncbi:MAG: hypothetical protein DYG94_00640 [Leptolyngbya sp. PLA3]|nr:MAG: hypothetical protein EDM82_01235 [Cyanobacteria bacterium CYA]MCE7967241.1 hypothetical protein [Leptolyngbya sp. PL-A3]